MTVAKTNVSNDSSTDAAARTRRYLAALPAPARRELTKIRAAIRAAAPKATPIFSYGIPGFQLYGKPLVWYAAFARHVSLFPMTAAIRQAHADALTGYGMSTGTIRFPLSDPPSGALVKRLVKARMAEVRLKAMAKPKGKAKAKPTVKARRKA